MHTFMLIKTRCLWKNTKAAANIALAQAGLTNMLSAFGILLNFCTLAVLFEKVRPSRADGMLLPAFANAFTLYATL